MGDHLLEALQRLMKHDIVGDVRGIGLLCGIELVEDKQTRKPFPAEYNISKRIGQKAIDKGVVLYPGKGSVDGQLGDHIMIVPPLIINEQHINELVDVLEESIKEVVNDLVQVTH
jgi:adenosylmethionine-8-amino-7-oxononanoate aminotransferase